LFGSFIGTAPVFDSSLAFMPGLRFPLPGPILVWLTWDTNEVSRFSCM
jgi:hypothetical protein